MIGIKAGNFVGQGGGADLAAYLALQASLSPIARWIPPASGTTWTDDIGGYHGTSAGSPTLGVADPFGGSGAATFDGSTQSVDVPYTAALAPTAAVTSEIWAYRASWSSMPNCGLGPNKTDEGGFGLWGSLNVSDRVTFYLRRNSSYGTPTTAGTPSNGWHHFVGTYDGRYTRLYMDGTLVATDDAGASYAIQYKFNNSLKLAADPTSSTGVQFPFAGSIYVAAVYGSALTATNIADLYAAATA